MPSIDEYRFASEADSSTCFDWGAGNSIELCGTGSQPLATQLAWDVPDFAARRVAHATAHLYADYHRHSSHGGGQRLAEYAAKISQTLMTVTGENQVTDETSIQIFHERAMWDLLRIFFVSAPYQPCLAQALVGWARDFYSLYEDPEAQPPLLQEVARLVALGAPEDDDAYWPLARKLLALGWVQEAGELLEAHSVYTTTYAQQQQHPNLMAQHTLMERMSRLLQRMPFLGVPPGGVGVATEATAADVADFTRERSEWVERVKQDLLKDPGLWQQAETQFASTTEGLTQMVAIMCGGEEAVGEACSSWLELLTARLCHMYPALPLQSSLAILLDKCLQEKGTSDDPCTATLQDMLSAIAEQEIQSIMRVCSEKGLAWLPAHAPDLLIPAPGARAILETHLPHLGYSQVEFFVLEYAGSLAEGPTTWHHALQYYARCPQGGRHAAEALIQFQAGRLDQREARKLQRAAAAVGLGDLHPTICRVQGHKALQEGRLGLALEWFLALGSSGLANEAASEFLVEIANAITSHPNELLGICQPDLLSQLQDLQGLLTQHAGRPDALGFLHALLAFQLGMLGKTPQDADKAARALEVLLKNSSVVSSEATQKLHASLALDLLLQGRSLLEHTPPVFAVADIESLRQTMQGLVWRLGVVDAEASQGCARKVVAATLALESALLY